VKPIAPQGKKGNATRIIVSQTPEMHRPICPTRVPKPISIGRQPVPLAANRCYLIQML
jgi:hypothetical protein